MKSRNIRLRLNEQTYDIRVKELLVISLFSLITASRAMNVGSDTINYFYSAHNINSYSSISEIISGYYVETGYGILEFICMKWFGDVHYIFLVESLILLLGLFSFIHCFEGKISIPMAFLVFFAFYYNVSLNISRQYIAVGIGLYATKYLLNGNKAKYLILCVLACCFHSTGILLVMSFIIYQYLFLGNAKKSFYRRLFILVMFIILCCILIRPLSVLLSSVGIIPSKYVDFLHQSDTSSSAVMTLISNTPILILLCIFRRKIIEYDEKNRIAITLFLLGFLVSMLNSFFGNVGRIAVFWTSWQIILYPECCEIMSNQQKKLGAKLMVKAIFVLFFIAYWYYCIMIRNFGNTNPYVSDVFDWLNFEFL